MLWMLKNVLMKDKMCMTRLALALGSFLWAVQLLPASDLFLTPIQGVPGTGGTLYSLMAALAPEFVWGCLFLVHSVWALCSVMVDVEQKWALYADGFLGCLLWTLVTASGYSAYWPVTESAWVSLIEYQPPAAMTGSLVLSLLAWWHMIRLWAEE